MRGSMNRDWIKWLESGGADHNHIGDVNSDQALKEKERNIDSIDSNYSPVSIIPIH